MIALTGMNTLVNTVFVIWKMFAQVKLWAKRILKWFGNKFHSRKHPIQTYVYNQDDQGNHVI